MKKKQTALARTLRRLMSEKDLTIKQLSELTEKEGHRVAPSSLSDWRNNHVTGDYQSLRIVSKILGVSLAFLTTGEPEENFEQSLAESFSEGEEVYSGYARVKVIQLIPKSKKKK